MVEESQPWVARRLLCQAGGQGGGFYAGQGSVSKPPWRAGVAPITRTLQIEEQEEWQAQRRRAKDQALSLRCVEACGCNMCVVWFRLMWCGVGVMVYILSVLINHYL